MTVLGIEIVHLKPRRWRVQPSDPLAVFKDVKSQHASVAHGVVVVIAEKRTYGVIRKGNSEVHLESVS